MTETARSSVISPSRLVLEKSLEQPSAALSLSQKQGPSTCRESSAAVWVVYSLSGQLAHISARNSYEGESAALSMYSG